MNDKLTTTKTFWGVVTVGLWLLLGALVMTKVIDLTAFIGALTTTGMAAFGMYQMYNKKKAEVIIKGQAEMMQHLTTELRKLHTNNTKLQNRMKMLEAKLNEPKTNEEKKPRTKAKKSNKKVGK